MDITIKNASLWDQIPDFESLDLSGAAMIICQLDKKLVTDIHQRLTSLGYETFLVQFDVSLKPNSVYLISDDHEFECDGSSIQLNQDTISTNLMELMLINYPQGSISLANDDLNIIYTSGSGYEEHNVDPNSIKGINIATLWEQNIFEGFQKALPSIRNGQLWEFESEFQGKCYLTTVSCIPDRKTFYYLIKSKDITERRKTETALLESEQRYRYFLDQSHEVICTHDLKGNYKLVSPSVKKMLGYHPEEMLGLHPYDFCYPEDKGIIRSTWTELLEGKRPKNIQYRAIRKDGSLIWVDSYSDIVTDSKGNVVSLTTASRDITNLKHIELELRKSEERFRGIADNLPGVIYLCLNDENYSMLYLNDEVKKLTGYKKEDFVKGNISFVDLYHPDDAPRVFEIVDGALERQESFHVTYRLKNIKTDSWVWVEEFGQGIYENGQLITLEGVLLDITKKIDNQLKLEQSEANLKAIFESTQSIIGLYNTENELIEFNSSFKNYILASDGVELKKGMGLADFITSDKIDEYKSYHNRVLKGEKLKITTEYPTPYGTIHLLSGLNPIFNKGEITGVSLFVEDITELKTSQKKLEQYAEDLEKLVKERTVELEEKNEELILGNEQLEAALVELQMAQDKLVQAEKMASLGVLSAGIAHEINNPLNFVKNGALALFNRIEEFQDYDEEEMRPYIELINGGVDRVTRIIKSLSHFSRDARTMNEKCNISSIIDNCLLILQNKLTDRIRVIKDVDSEAIVFGNEGKLHQAMLNLLSNAEQSIDGNGEIKISAKPVGTLVELIIEDNGSGISQENLVKIGDPFFTTKPPGEGTGLGLFITYSIIEEHRGKIEVSSIVKKGTKIRIELPNL
ncbi:PAS domain S-box protein [Marinoscillum pacificum]|uniref:PAS domain S-box protein n=1 Tax=Marinoscillum pacificum TaxID=392723 RepID=UPI00215808AC|nr:PAS domain S-box protein [Marinoscillum pacificum]